MDYDTSSDKIDKVSARHCGFTDKKLKLIINYDIKNRMGNELQQTWEPLIRRIIREELLRLSRQKNILYPTPEMVLYTDM